MQFVVDQICAQRSEQGSGTEEKFHQDTAQQCGRLKCICSNPKYFIFNWTNVSAIHWSAHKK